MRKLQKAGWLLLLALGGCFGESAEDMMKTARFEEKQNNPTHARQIYQRVIENHPDTPQAKEAAERLQTLESQPAD